MNNRMYGSTQVIDSRPQWMKVAMLPLVVSLIMLLVVERDRLALAQSPTPIPSSLISYTVVAGDTLTAIAVRYHTNVSAIQASNGLTSDLIRVGQGLKIPVEPTTSANGDTLLPTSVATAPSVVVRPPLRHAILEGDLNIAYPITVVSDAFTLHYASDPPPALSPQTLIAMINAAMLHNQQVLGATLLRQLDIYVAGALFASPNQHLLGRSFSGDWRIFFLNDGTAPPLLQQYIIAHELTHVTTWHSFGIPHSPMLSEGTAVYAGMQMIGDSGHLPIHDFCLAYARAGRLPRISADLAYLGHIRNLENYYAAGCFVKFLIERYGVKNFSRLYATGQYRQICGKSLLTLEAEWQATLTGAPTPLSFEPLDLIRSVEALTTAHKRLFSVPITTPQQMATYREVSAIWVALFEGRLDLVKRYFGW